MSVVVNIAGSPVSIFSGDRIKISDKEAGTSTAQFTVWDAPGTATYTQQQTVTITDSVFGLQFGGYIDSAQPELINPTASKKWIIICKDKTWLPSKRQVIQPDFAGTLAGDAVTDLHTKYLAAEGVTANYALDHDTDSTTFGAGTLVSTSASSGDLTLALAGTTFTKTETSTTDFNTGTLTNVVGANNALSLTSTAAMKYTGTATANLGTNLYVYTEISTASVTLNTDDQFVYDVFVSSTSPSIVCGLDITFTDNTTLRDIVVADQYGFACHPNTVLSGYANDQWMHRVFPLTTPTVDLTGKTIAFCSIAFEGDAPGTYTAYVRNATIQNSSNVVRITFFSSTLSVNKQIGNQGYYGVKLSTVTAYSDTGQRVSSAYSISNPAIAKSSLISWSEAPYVQPMATNAANYPPPILLETSYDGGATWQTCTNHTPLPDLLAGFTTTSKTLTFRQTLSLAGPDPTITPALLDCTASIAPSYAATKSDAMDSDKTSTDFASGTLTNVTYYAATGTNVAGEQLTGMYRGWDDGDISNMTTYGTIGSNAVLGMHNSQVIQRCGLNPAPSEMRSRMDWAGQWQNFIAEIDIVHHTDITSSVNMGLVYRTTGWQNANDTYAYAVQMEAQSITLVRGTNTPSGAGAGTIVQRVTVLFVASDTYHIKLVVNGNTHQVYINDILYINATDSTWTAAGYLGLRLYNDTIPRVTAFFDNFGIMSSAFTGSRVHSTLALNALGSVENSIILWNAYTPGNATLLIESSINGGSTWATCTNNAVIPQLTPGVSTIGVSLLIRETLSTQNANSTPILSGITALVVGNYNATGTRVSPSLAIGSVGRVGSSSITWTANTPTGTTLVVEESLIGATGAWTAATNGGAIPTITAQPVSVSDGFSVSTAGNYTSTNYSAGVNATWTFDTTNSRLTALNGTNGLYVWNQVSAKDVQVDATLNQAANAGLIWRYTDVNNFYFAIISDASSGTNPNTIKIYKRAASVTSGVLASVVIAFTRGTYHTFKVISSTTSHTAYFDGVSMISIVDASLAGPGSIGFLQSSTTQTNWYSIRGQQFGDDVTGKSVWTRLTLTSTDPTLTPAVTDLVTSVRGQQLMSGGVIGVQNYQYNASVMAALSDIAGKCPGYTVGVTDAGALTFQSHAATPADWPLATVNSSLINGQQIGDIQWSTPPTLVKQSPLYRNRSIIVGGIDTTTLIPDTRMGDGFTQSWELAWPVAFAPAITLNGQSALVGVQGVDTGMDFYYQIGSKTISQDLSETPLDGSDVLSIPYYGQIPVVEIANNTAQQTIVAALEGSTTGIVEVVTKVAGLNALAAQALATSDCAQWSILSQTWTFVTLRGGLHSGQLLPVYCPEYGATLADVLMLITDVEQVIMQGGSDSTTITFYTVTCTSGANVGSWSTIYV